MPTRKRSRPHAARDPRRGAQPCAPPDPCAPTSHQAQLHALAAVLNDDNGAAFQLCRKLDPVQLQDLGLACQELERICESVFWAEYGTDALRHPKDRP